jgi:hypothetical protein
MDAETIKAIGEHIVLPIMLFVALIVLFWKG